MSEISVSPSRTIQLDKESITKETKDLLAKIEVFEKEIEKIGQILGKDINKGKAASQLAADVLLMLSLATQNILLIKNFVTQAEGYCDSMKMMDEIMENELARIR